MNVETVLSGPRPFKPITTEARHRWRLAPYLFKEKGLSRSQVAELLGVTEGTAANLINGPSEGEIGRRMMTKLRNQSNPMTGVKRLPGVSEANQAREAGLAGGVMRKRLALERVRKYVTQVDTPDFTVNELSVRFDFSRSVCRHMMTYGEEAGLVRRTDRRRGHRNQEKVFELAEGAV